MKLKSGFNTFDEKEKKDFAYWILALGDGRLGSYNDS